MMEVRKSKFLRAIALLIIILALCVKIGKAQNVKPVADAGSSRYAGPDSIVLNGTASYDADNSGPLSFNWQQLTGPGLTISDANTAAPTISSFVQTDEIQECEFELVVSDGELISLPDNVKVIIVPDFGQITLEQENPPFDPNKPTVFYFSGGDCTIGFANEQSWGNSDWFEKANIISFPRGYQPDNSYENYRTYYHIGDMIIVFLSSVAPVYHQPIQTIGWSTGEQPAMDAAIRINRVYEDSRYAINRVTGLDAPCRWVQVGSGYRPLDSYIESLELLLESAVDGEQCWRESYAQLMGEDIARGVLAVDLGLIGHSGVRDWYRLSLTTPQANVFNNGVIGGAYWSVVGPGKNLQLIQGNDYRFRLLDGTMYLADEETYPAKLPEPVTLVGPPDGELIDPNGALFSCELSENAVGYQLLFGTDPYRVMDYDIVSDTPSPPTEIITSFPYEQTWWTVRVYDAFGSTIYADPRYINVAFHTNAKYGGGTGEPNEPYLIYTAEQMNAIGAEPNDRDKHFKLMEDIDLSAYTGTDFNIIGPFRGVFDGNGHTISNFSYTTTTGPLPGGGLFRSLGGVIKDLGLINPNVDLGTGTHAGSLAYSVSTGTISNCYAEGASVSGNEYVGGLVGYNYRGTITNCTSSGSVSGNDDVGGLVGHNYDGTITDCYTSGSVTGDDYVGGLVGGNSGTISNCYAAGSVSGSGTVRLFSGVGGLVGYNHGTISDCSSAGSVSGTAKVGGFVGGNYNAYIENCYATGSVSGTTYVGGLLGENWYGTINNSYSVGRVTATTDVGGLVGLNSGVVTDSFWDTQTSGHLTSAGGTGKTTAEMQMAGTFLDAGWDFVDESENGTEDIWWIDEGQGYPRLWWEPSSFD